jgi:hypothetical protein
MKRVINALKSTAITLGIGLVFGITWFCIIRFFSPEAAMAIIFAILAVGTFYINYKK